MRPLVILILVALGAAPLPAQQPIFRADVRLVNVTVVARDSSGRAVTNLAASDFHVFEDGKEQQIEVFAIETDRPVQTASVAAPAQAPAPNLFTNRLEQRNGGGVTVVLFDRLNSSFEDQKNARDQIIRLLAKAQPRDHIALYVLESDTVTVLHDFTSDASRLIAVLNRYLGTTSVELARSEERAPDFARTGIASLDADTEAWLNRSQQMVSEIFLRCRAQLTTDALEGIANHLAGVPGRKNLVWVSAAFPFVIETEHGPQVMDKQVNRATRAINSADIAVYPVDIRGLIGAFANPATANAPLNPGQKPSGSIHDDGEYASQSGHDAYDRGGHRWAGVPQHERDRRGDPSRHR